MKKVTQTQIKKQFNERGIQVGSDVMEMINYEIMQFVNRMAKRCVDGNIKRLSSKDFWIAMGRLNHS
tara:strand:+ start:334 stop:534 length:201 start_codon:yes stop_codon:yes gene_type:complete